MSLNILLYEGRRVNSLLRGESSSVKLSSLFVSIPVCSFFIWNIWNKYVIFQNAIHYITWIGIFPDVVWITVAFGLLTYSTFPPLWGVHAVCITEDWLGWITDCTLNKRSFLNFMEIWTVLRVNIIFFFAYV